MLQLIRLDFRTCAVCRTKQFTIYSLGFLAATRIQEGVNECKNKISYSNYTNLPQSRVGNSSFGLFPCCCLARISALLCFLKVMGLGGYQKEARPFLLTQTFIKLITELAGRHIANIHLLFTILTFSNNKKPHLQPLLLSLRVRCRFVHSARVGVGEQWQLPHGRSNCCRQCTLTHRGEGAQVGDVRRV